MEKSLCNQTPRCISCNTEMQLCSSGRAVAAGLGAGIGGVVGLLKGKGETRGNIVSGFSAGALLGSCFGHQYDRFIRAKYVCPKCGAVRTQPFC